MRPRRDVFALDYLSETLDKFEKLTSARAASAIDEQEFAWFTNVLQSYFEVTNDHPVIEAQRQRFLRLRIDVTGNDKNEGKVPFAQARRVVSGIDYQAFRTLCEQRKSVRWFQERSVPRELIRQVIDVARFSPSACNRYPFRFLVFDESDKIATVSRLPGGTVGFAENFPVIIAIVGELRNYYGERDRHLIYVDASLAAMSVVLAAETLGLATCCINWPDIEEAEKEAERVLGLEPDQRPVMFMALGYPDPEGLVAYSQKKSFDEVIEFNRSIHP